VLDLQDIHLDYPPDLLPLSLGKGNEIIPPGVFIPHKSPVEPVYKIEEEDEREEKMSETDHSEHVTLGGFQVSPGYQGIPYQVTGDAEYEDAKGIDPVVEPDWQLPDVDLPEVHVSCFYP
jgi:hypothetical protein